jgi:hypothetical protein
LTFPLSDCSEFGNCVITLIDQCVSLFEDNATPELNVFNHRRDIECHVTCSATTGNNYGTVAMQFCIRGQLRSIVILSVDDILVKEKFGPHCPSVSNWIAIK